MGTRMVLFDDVTGEPAADVSTISFGVDGRDFVIDLSADNAAALRKALDPWIEHATAVRPPPRSRYPTPTPTDRADCRAYAKQLGIEVPPEGSHRPIPQAAWIAWRRDGSPKRKLKPVGRKRKSAAP